MPPKRTSTSEAPAMTQAAIRKLVADSVSVALEAQAANMANTNNTTRPREAPVARQDKIEGLGKGWVIIQQDFDNLEAELRESHTQIAKLQRKQMGNNNKIALARFRIANLEQIIEDIQVRHQADKESLLDAIYEHKNSQEGPSDY
ncbi:hypothetical protein Tco_0432994 [Tanacetum coccineum]